MAIATDRDGNLTLVKRASGKAAKFAFLPVDTKQQTAESDEERRKNFWEKRNDFRTEQREGAATMMPYASEAAMLADKAYYTTPWTEPVQRPLPKPQRNMEVQPRRQPLETSA